MLSRFEIPERKGQTADGRTDGRTNGRTGRRTDRIAIQISHINVLTRDKNLRYDENYKGKMK